MKSNLYATMKVRKADLSAVGELSELNRRLIEDEHHPNPMNAQQLTQRMSRWLQEEYTCYLATENGITIAYCLFRDDEEHYYLRQLFVDRAHRRKGIATKLLDWMYQNVWTDKKVRLDVLALKLRAVGG